MAAVKIIVIAAAVIFIALFAYGLTLSDATLRIGECSASFSRFEAEVNDTLLCPASGACTASPELQRHNAAVDVLLCACARAKSSGYGDAQLNAEIEALGASVAGAADAQTLCGSQLLTKRAYE